MSSSVTNGPFAGGRIPNSRTIMFVANRKALFTGVRTQATRSSIGASRTAQRSLSATAIVLGMISPNVKSKTVMIAVDQSAAFGTPARTNSTVASESAASSTTVLPMRIEVRKRFLSSSSRNTASLPLTPRSSMPRARNRESEIKSGLRAREKSGGGDQDEQCPDFGPVDAGIDRRHLTAGASPAGGPVAVGRCSNRRHYSTSRRKRGRARAARPDPQAWHSKNTVPLTTKPSTPP